MAEIRILPALQRFIDDLVDKGLYLDTNDVVNTALRQMKSRVETGDTDIGGEVTAEGPEAVSAEDYGGDVTEEE